MGLQFDGVDARITTTTTTGVPTGVPITCAAVVRFDTIGLWQGLIQASDNSVARGFNWEIDDANHLWWEDNAGGGNIPSTGTVAANTWYFLATTVAAGGTNGMRHYCYNLQTRAVVFNELQFGVPPLTLSGDTLKIGTWAGDPSTYSDFLDGTMDWIAIWNTHFNATDPLLTLATLGPYAFGAPVCLWDFRDNVQGSTATSARERLSGNTGTLTNFAFDGNDGWRPHTTAPYWLRQAARVSRIPAAGAPATLPPGFVPRYQAAHRAATI